MADLADIERGLVSTLAGAFFPAGGYQAGALTSGGAAGVPARVYRGWPTAAELDADMIVIGGAAHVTVFPEQGMTRLTTRYPREWFVPVSSSPTLTATVAGAVVTFGGTGGAGQIVGIAFGTAANLAAYAYRVLGGDTPSTVASALAAMIAGASAVGAVLTLPTPYTVNAIVAADTTALRELRRQVQGFRVSCWCSTPIIRDTVAALADQAFAALVDSRGNPTEFITLPAGDTARVQYASTITVDRTATDRLWRRDIRLSVEYGTTVAQTQPLAVFASLGIGIALGGHALAAGADAVVTAGPQTPEVMVMMDQYGNVLFDAAGNVMGPVPT